MSLSIETELARFERFVSECVEGDKANLSPEETLDLWRAENPHPDDAAETILAIRQALNDIAAGERGVPLEEFDVRFRQKHGLVQHPE
ncbi:MAG: hypothetical protein ACT4QC_07660 [Planctomycetaceae bacterium]